MIAAIVVGWRLGANAVLSFWLAYILTRPLGANLGDWLAPPPAEESLGLGTAATTAIFLLAILGTVIYLTVTRKDVAEGHEPSDTPTITTSPSRERAMLGYYGAVALLSAAVLVWAAHQPHSAPARAEAAGSPTADQAATPAGGPGSSVQIPPPDWRSPCWPPRCSSS